MARQYRFVQHPIRSGSKRIQVSVTGSYWGTLATIPADDVGNLFKACQEFLAKERLGRA